MNDPGSTAIESLRIEPAAEWFGRRLCALMARDAPALQRPVAWCLHQWMQGHTCLDLDGSVQAPPLDEDVTERLEAKVPVDWAGALQDCASVARAAAGSLDPIASPLVLEGRRLFLSRCRSQEIAVACDLARRAAAPAAWFVEARGSASLEPFLADLGASMHPAQVQAVRLACTRRLALITGGPGTGKTTVAARVIEGVMRLTNPAIQLLAPTGKAAARLQESIRARATDPSVSPEARTALAGLQAETLHGAILRRQGEAVRRAQLIVVDETSMVDLERMQQLLRLAGEQATIVLLGDEHQLASVEAGTVLADLVREPAIAGCVARLSHSYRFPSDRGVGRLAAAVNAGDANGVLECLRAQADGVRWIEVTSASQVASRAAEERVRLGPDTRILCGHRRGPDGASRLNQSIVRSIAGAANGHFPGRPILITVNDDNTGLRNGDAGLMRRDGSGWVAEFHGRDPVPAEQLPSHETAFALTIHKTQGSEYPAVVVALPARPSPVLTRELLYTGVTRTKQAVTVVATAEAIRASVERPIVRSSGLRERLEAAMRPAPC